MRGPLSAPGLRWALFFSVVAGLALAAILGLTQVSRASARPRLSGYQAGRNVMGSGGGAARPMTVYNLPTVVVPPAAPVPATPVSSAPAAAPGPALATGGGEQILDNPNNTGAPADLDPNRPYGPPVVRTDWVISKDYAAHGGPGPWGAVDFAYWYDRDAFGSPIVATHAGTVHLIPDDAIFGNWVWVVNAHFTTRYGHTQKYLVTEGQAVVRGTVLAEMGSTGHSTGPHVDYQVWQDGVNKNPMDFLK